MALRKAAALALASLALAGGGLVGSASAASATAAGDNSLATVEGVDGVPARGDGTDCAFGRLCLYTEPNYRGTRFDLYVCRDYRLAQWNGFGSAWNAQTVGTVARFKDQEYRVIGTIKGRDPSGTIYGYSAYDFSPVWYANNC
ncbi:peptidase inhibitor family I36 protein [Streptomyces sp. KHY 26]|uniref:peptidase inhibitor family I36 protein n=1 Tax=Streptomyces sp. KHY 26 TaxID=3097359 RepID=UPI00376F14EF